ncbi:MAG TPA: signal peptidase I [Opitutaceae bacterium]|jgi:signal peptidase I|nr:signal peptidase I [Opitutaceae bacterium]
MFGFFTSQEKKIRASARQWLELAEKVFNFRRDQLTAAESAELQKCTEDLRGKIKQRTEAEKLKLSVEALEPVLRRTGGKVYPKGELTEWVEFFLVAGIVLIGIRTYFISPFQIPTNSMWPSYYGMTDQVYPAPQEDPGLVGKALNFITLGAVHHDVIAPQSGEVTMDFSGSVPLFTKKSGRKWLVVPTDLHEYTFYVNDAPVTVDVPEDFDFRKTIIDAFFKGDEAAFLQRLGNESDRAEQVIDQIDADHAVRGLRMDLGQAVSAGGRVLSFDVRAGDMLFVDRFSYHFVRPKVGSGFVFRTDIIPGLQDGTVEADTYFIKRLVGVPGDTLEIREPVLYRNGQPITGATIFEKEFKQIDGYPGYRNRAPGNFDQIYLTKPGDTVTVPAGDYFACGDNSSNSKDSRYWGFVPAAAVVGRPLFVYYPFTSRWGPRK